MGATVLDPISAVPVDLMSAALSLPSSIRVQFTSSLFDSVDESEDDSTVMQNQWKSEIARRLADVRTGKVKVVDGHATLLRLRQELEDRYGV